MVAVVVLAADRANPIADVQVLYQLVLAATGKTGLARRIERLDFQEFPAVQFCLVGKLAEELWPAYIRDCLREPVVLEHSLHIQVLHGVVVKCFCNTSVQ